jgi:hydrogenase 3 maturation protease
MENIAKAWRARGTGRIMILGVGNPLRGDDGVGPTLIRRLRRRCKFALLDCGEAPENYTKQILQFGPDTLILVDAADWKGRPGEIRQIGEDEIANANFFTHNLSLRLLLDYLKRQLRTSIIILAVQVKDREYLDPMSPEVKRAIGVLEDLICSLPGPMASESPESYPPGLR